MWRSFLFLQKQASVDTNARAFPWSQSKTQMSNKMSFWESPISMLKQYVWVLWAKFKLMARRFQQVASSLYLSSFCPIFPLSPSLLGLGFWGELPFQFGNCSISSPAGLRSGGEARKGEKRLRLACSPRWGWQVREGPDLFSYPLCRPSVLINLHRFMGF